MGTGGLGRISCRETTREMRAQNPQSARQPACEHRRVLAVGILLLFCIHHFIILSKSSSNELFST
jgi:hypothetical protein